MAAERESSLTLHKPYLLAIVAFKKKGRVHTTRSTRQRKKKSVMEGEGEGREGTKEWRKEGPAEQYCQNRGQL